MKLHESIAAAQRAIASRVLKAKAARDRAAEVAKVASALEASDSAARALEDAVRPGNVDAARRALLEAKDALETLSGLGVSAAKTSGLKRRVARSESKLMGIAGAEELARVRAAKLAEEKAQMARNKGPRPKESEWDGAVPCVKYWMKRNMKDPDSFDIMEASPVAELPKFWAQRIKYRARNSFGGYVIEEKIIGFWNTNNDLLNCSIQEVIDL